MNETMPKALMVLCHSDGRIATADREAISLLGNTGGSESGGVTIAQIAAKADCAELIGMFEYFVAGELASAKSTANCGNYACQVSLRRLNGFQSQPLIAVEVVRTGHYQAEQTEQAEQAEQGLAQLIEVGRATGRLIHDFKNQMSGLKLYAAYLKKRFADQPEGVEIAEKIVQSLNEMTENALLVGKLTRPIDLKLLEEDLAVLVRQTVYNLQPQAALRNVEFISELEKTAFLMFDAQQMRLALNSLFVQAIESSPLGGMVRVVLQASENNIRLSIFNRGSLLSEEQRQSFFDFLTNERLNKISLGLALARRIIEAHGGTATVQAVQPDGREILVRF